jgi:hypothetical protein
MINGHAIEFDREEDRMSAGGRVRKAMAVGMTLLLIAMAFAIMPMSVGAKFAGGKGTADDPYQISTLEQLQDVDKHLGAHFILINNIDASPTSSWNDGAGFYPIGLGAWGFYGDFDGDGYVISNLFVNRPNSNGIGLFSTSHFGTIKDLGVVDVDIVGSWYTGGLAGFQEGTISNCYASGSVSGIHGVGMLIGNTWGPVMDSHSTGIVTGIDFVGGLLGVSSNIVSNCYSTTTVIGFNCAGGLVGAMGDGTTMSDSYAAGPVSGDSHVGGLVGTTWFQGSISHSYATGAVTGTNYHAGGLVGSNSVDLLVFDCYATGDVVGANDVGGFIGANQGRIMDSYSTGTSRGSGVAIGGFTGGNAHQGEISGCFATGSVSGGEWTGGFTGFAGGLIDRSYATGNVIGTISVGGFCGVGWQWGLISNSYATGSVHGTIYIGGFLGHNTPSIVENSYSKGRVTGQSAVGGFVGHIWLGSIRYSYWDVATSGQTWSAGGYGRSTAQMMQQANYYGWDFLTTWDITEGASYPYLLYPPVADAGTDLNAMVGESVTFVGGGSYDPFGGAIASYSWTFGDTNTGTGKTVAHNYNAVGIYTVTLTVTDAVGLTGSDICTVNVKTPTQATDDLSTDIKGMGLATGTETNLVSKVDAAVDLLENGNTKGASQKLGDFIDYVNAQRGKKLTGAQADELISTAQWIIDNL